MRLHPETYSWIAVLTKQASMLINAFIKAALEKRIAMIM